MTALFIRRPVMTALVMIGILFFGAVSYTRLAVSDLPTVDFPTIQVNANLPGASPETMAAAVATPLEKQFSTIAGIDNMTSSSGLGSSSITIQFSLDRSIDAAAQDVQAAISQTLRSLPLGILPPSYRKVNPADAPSMIFGYAVGIDLTRRDMQAAAKKTGRPWDMSKGFDQSAPIGPVTRGVPPPAGAITLTIDGQVRQSGDLSDMIWSVAEIIASLSTYVAVAAGDLIFTGTPAGVGPIQRGELVRGMIAGIDPVEVTFE